jgi:N,N'-diacetyllegionaminate synthase
VTNRPSLGREYGNPRERSKIIPQNRVFIIAEAGVNHNGSIQIAMRLVEEAGRAGADCVKFQSFSADRLASRSARKASYQNDNTRGADTQYEMLKRLELSEEDHRALLDCCRANGILFLSSPFDEESADMLENLGVRAYKIPSGEVTNHGFLRYLAGKNKPMILSTGMSTLAEVAEAIQVISGRGSRQLYLLHCVTEYPAPVDEINLKAMLTLANAFGYPVGYSDHTQGTEIAIAAVALGARIVEKHFTLSRDMPGPDHQASLEPQELSAMVRAIRNVEKSLGDGLKVPAACEMKNMAVVRKSVVAQRNIMSGEPISRDNVAIKRPGYGIQPRDIENVLGLRATTDIRADSVVTWDDLK